MPGSISNKSPSKSASKSPSKSASKSASESPSDKEYTALAKNLNEIKKMMNRGANPDVGHIKVVSSKKGGKKKTRRMKSKKSRKSRKSRKSKK
jgi:hypothetical protein